jgi:hypothetical protein
MFTKENVCWHFTGNTLRDGSPIPDVGIPLIHKGPVHICESGLHWSRQPFQALKYAPGCKLHMVEVDGTIFEQEDKGVSSKRTIIKSIDATYLLRRFSADQALSVKHLWDMPDIVEQYLISLDENKRVAARDAARDAVWVAAGAVWVAARVAARVAVWDAARDAAKDAAKDAARVAARDAARDAVWVAAGAAAGAAARGKVSEKFNSRVYKEFGLEN